MYDRFPYIPVSSASECVCGWEPITDELRRHSGSDRRVLCVECYPGVFVNEAQDWLTRLLKPSLVIPTDDLLIPPADLNRRAASTLTEDPVFGVMK